MCVCVFVCVCLCVWGGEVIGIEDIPRERCILFKKFQDLQLFTSSHGRLTASDSVLQFCVPEHNVT